MEENYPEDFQDKNSTEEFEGENRGEIEDIDFQDEFDELDRLDELEDEDGENEEGEVGNDEEDEEVGDDEEEVGDDEEKLDEKEGEKFEGKEFGGKKFEGKEFEGEEPEEISEKLAKESSIRMKLYNEYLKKQSPSDETKVEVGPYFKFVREAQDIESPGDIELNIVEEDGVPPEESDDIEVDYEDIEDVFDFDISDLKEPIIIPDPNMPQVIKKFKEKSKFFEEKEIPIEFFGVQQNIANILGLPKKEVKIKGKDITETVADLPILYNETVTLVKGPLGLFLKPKLKRGVIADINPPVQKKAYRPPLRRIPQAPKSYKGNLKYGDVIKAEFQRTLKEPSIVDGDEVQKNKVITEKIQGTIIGFTDCCFKILDSNIDVPFTSKIQIVEKIIRPSLEDVKAEFNSITPESLYNDQVPYALRRFVINYLFDVFSTLFDVQKININSEEDLDRFAVEKFGLKSYDQYYSSQFEQWFQAKYYGQVEKNINKNDIIEESKRKAQAKWEPITLVDDLVWRYRGVKPKPLIQSTTLTELNPNSFDRNFLKPEMFNIESFSGLSDNEIKILIESYIQKELFMLVYKINAFENVPVNEIDKMFDLAKLSNLQNNFLSDIISNFGKYKNEFPDVVNFVNIGIDFAKVYKYISLNRIPVIVVQNFMNISGMTKSEAEEYLLYNNIYTKLSPKTDRDIAVAIATEITPKTDLENFEDKVDFVLGIITEYNDAVAKFFPKESQDKTPEIPITNLGQDIEEVLPSGQRRDMILKMIGSSLEEILQEGTNKKRFELFGSLLDDIKKYALLFGDQDKIKIDLIVQKYTGVIQKYNRKIVKLISLKGINEFVISKMVSDDEEFILISNVIEIYKDATRTTSKLKAIEYTYEKVEANTPEEKAKINLLISNYENNLKSSPKAALINTYLQTPPGLILSSIIKKYDKIKFNPEPDITIKLVPVKEISDVTKVPVEKVGDIILNYDKYNINYPDVVKEINDEKQFFILTSVEMINRIKRSREIQEVDVQIQNKLISIKRNIEGIKLANVLTNVILEYVNSHLPLNSDEIGKIIAERKFQIDKTATMAKYNLDIVFGPVLNIILNDEEKDKIKAEYKAKIDQNFIETSKVIEAYDKLLANEKNTNKKNQYLRDRKIKIDLLSKNLEEIKQYYDTILQIPLSSESKKILESEYKEQLEKNNDDKNKIDSFFYSALKNAENNEVRKKIQAEYKAQDDVIIRRRKDIIIKYRTALRTPLDSEMQKELKEDYRIQLKNINDNYVNSMRNLEKLKIKLLEPWREIYEELIRKKIYEDLNSLEPTSEERIEFESSFSDQLKELYLKERVKIEEEIQEFKDKERSKSNKSPIPPTLTKEQLEEKLRREIDGQQEQDKKLEDMTEEEKIAFIKKQSQEENVSYQSDISTKSRHFVKKISGQKSIISYELLQAHIEQFERNIFMSKKSIFSYIDSIAHPITFIANNRLGQYANFFRAKIGSFEFKISSLSVINLAYTLPELVMNTEISDQTFEAAIEQIKFVWKFEIDHILRSYISKVDPSRKRLKSDLPMTFRPTFVKYLVNPIAVCNFDTSSGYKYTTIQKDGVEKIKYQKLDGKYIPIPLGELSICYTKNKGFSCHDQRSILKAIAKNPNNPINPHTDMPFPKIFVDKMKKYHSKTLKDTKFMTLLKEDADLSDLEDQSEDKPKDKSGTTLKDWRANLAAFYKGEDPMKPKTLLLEQFQNLDPRLLISESKFAILYIRSDQIKKASEKFDKFIEGLELFYTDIQFVTIDKDNKYIGTEGEPKLPEGGRSLKIPWLVFYKDGQKIGQNISKSFKGAETTIEIIEDQIDDRFNIRLNPDQTRRLKLTIDPSSIVKSKKEKSPFVRIVEQPESKEEGKKELAKLVDEYRIADTTQQKYSRVEIKGPEYSNIDVYYLRANVKSLDEFGTDIYHAVNYFNNKYIFTSDYIGDEPDENKLHPQFTYKINRQEENENGTFLYRTYPIRVVSIAKRDKDIPSDQNRGIKIQDAEEAKISPFSETLEDPYNLDEYSEIFMTADRYPILPEPDSGIEPDPKERALNTGPKTFDNKVNIF